VVDQQDHQSGFDPPVLKGIVENNYFKGRVFFQQKPDSSDPVGINGKINVGEFSVNLKRFIPDLGRCHIRRGRHKASRKSPVASAQHGSAVLFFEKPDEVFHMGSFSGATDSNIANADYGDVEFYGTQNFHVVQKISYSYDEAVHQGKGQKVFSQVPEHGPVRV